MNINIKKSPVYLVVAILLILLASALMLSQSNQVLAATTAISEASFNGAGLNLKGAPITLTKLIYQSGPIDVPVIIQFVSGETRTSIIRFNYVPSALSLASATNQLILDNFSKEVYRMHKNTDLNSLISNISRGHIEGVNAIRVLEDQALMHTYYYQTYYYQRDGNPDDLIKAKTYIKTGVEKYSAWKKIWGSGVTMNMLTINAMWLWQDLDLETKGQIYQAVVEEADYWTGILNEIKNNPNGTNVSVESGRRAGQPNWSLITSNVNPLNGIADDHLNDTRAEENGWNAQFLATAYNMFPDHPNADSWNTAAKCFAFHTFTNTLLGQTACGITSRTIDDDYKLGNHNLSPSPGYTLAGVTALQQGQLAYILAGKPVPSEFKHGIEQGINSPVWQKNVAQCMDSNFQITSSPVNCHPGQDWGDRNLLSSAMMLGYFAKLQNDTEAETILNQLLNYFASHDSNTIMFPFASYVANVSSENAGILDTNNKVITKIGKFTQTLQDGSLEWWKNLEMHPQESAKYFLVSNYLNSDFRKDHFPQNPGATLVASNIQVSCSDNGTSATAIWTGVAGAGQYTLRLNKEPFDVWQPQEAPVWASSNSGDHTFDTDTSNQKVFPVLPKANYQFTVQAMIAGEVYPYKSPISFVKSFSCTDSSPTSVPQAGAITFNGAGLNLKGAPITLTKLIYQSGPIDVPVIVTDPSGETRYLTIRFNYNTPISSAPIPTLTPTNTVQPTVNPTVTPIESGTDNNLPIGYQRYGIADYADTCVNIRGWTCDLDSKDTQLQVDFWDIKSSGNIFLGSVTANLYPEQAVSDICGNSIVAHGYTFPIPASLKDGTNHIIQAHGININSEGQRFKAESSPVLRSGPSVVNCAQ